jgi:hypothetical protein
VAGNRRLRQSVGARIQDADGRQGAAELRVAMRLDGALIVDAADFVL